ncbi:hypothetical protein FNV43_RR07708 [Rhamnella rubrinervis]|uniref:Receptor-like serine/threonine-protein kinase n=1 Tax=Rhamnella rubrinervis TaxID=2594499 RepID=A0A8K0MMZ5_9ROSA|nr:hypothetical protein FNV43_RR07708 [Rhamnella rubrinervis]
MITPNHPLKDGDLLLSSRKTFALGFFSPENSHNRYVGVWYNKVPEQTVVWVANRDDPINDTSGVLAINAAVVSSANNPVAELLDVGNLVLIRNSSQGSVVIWQGFDYPTDTMLPFMKLGLERRSGLNRFLTSWKSADDPGTGNCSYRIDTSGYPQLFLYKGQARWWRAGSWTGQRWSGVPEMTPNFIYNVTYVNNQDEISVKYGILNDSIFSKMTLKESGLVERSTWHDQPRRWNMYWSAPRESCDEYGKCGVNGNCDPGNRDEFECTCLPGFEPKSPRDWLLRDASGGCVRKRAARTCKDREGFVKVGLVKVPDTSKARVNMSLSLSLKACEQECLGDCSCTAYTSADETQGGIGCLTWHGDMLDTRTYPHAGQDLYVRVDSSTLRSYYKAEYANAKKSSITKSGKVAILVVSVIVCFLLAVLVYWNAKRKRKVKERHGTYSFSKSLNTSAYFEDSPGSKELDDESRRNSDLRLFSLKTIAAATGNFSDANKLGEGGFGSVYKGVLHNGKEIAVKRLSKYSRQGNNEFKNEVMLIAKLQHRNLLRMLGCCVQEEEKMLIYEYLPNKSLDFFIFDETKRTLLDWRKRFDIICGVARGMLYLHQDSRLRIIHRDLKASNVLLDEALNPKIADFGMARIFGANQMEANTNRVVGTYGYMSPEYAMEGLFSVKSDVYSFGVLILEIITGYKNSGTYKLDPVPIWLDICDHVGNSATHLHSPKKPAFVMKKSYTSRDPTTSEGANSINDVTCTVVEAR